MSVGPRRIRVPKDVYVAAAKEQMAAVERRAPLDNALAALDTVLMEAEEAVARARLLCSAEAFTTEPAFTGQWVDDLLASLDKARDGIHEHIDLGSIDPDAEFARVLRSYRRAVSKSKRQAEGGAA